MAQNGTLIDPNTVVRISWRGWHAKLTKWRIDQAKFMPAIGISAPSGSYLTPQPSDVSPITDGDSDFDSDAEDDENDTTSQDHTLA